MRKTARSIVLAFLTLLSAVVLGVTTMLTSAGLSLAAETTVTALIMGGSGTPDPNQEVGYVPNVSSYYIFPNSACKADNCTLKPIVTPEQAWPLYGGLSALTWKQSILQGVEIYDAAVRAQLPTADTNVVLFGYSQSGAILAIEKRALADDPTIPQAQKDKLQIVVIGNVSRPNGGLNGRLPDFTLPIVEFPFGPTMPTDTTIDSTDIALKWDIIADAPLYVFNPLALLNAFIGGPGFGINHGTYPNPEGVPPTGLVGGYSQTEWQAIMDDPQWFADNYPDLVTVQPRGAGSDTTYITVTPKVLPLVVPLHSLGLGFVADLVEPALRVIIEETGYDRSIPYGQPTPFRLFPVFDPIKLAVDVIAAIPQGIQQALNGGPPPLVGPNGPITDSSTVSSFDSQALAGPTTTGVDSLSNKSTPTPTLTLVKQDNQVDAQDPEVEEKSLLSGGSTQPTADEPGTPTPADPPATKSDDPSPRAAGNKDDVRNADDKKADDKKADDKKADDKKSDETKADTDTEKKDTDTEKKDTTDTKPGTDKKSDNKDADNKDADNKDAA
jgi:PE-PPE domain